MTQRGRAAMWTRDRLGSLRPHPLIQTVALTSASPAVRFQACVSVDHQMYLWDHRVSGRGLLPAAAFTQSRHFCTAPHPRCPRGCVRAAITSPLVLPSAGASALVVCSVNPHTGDLEISSSVNGRRILHPSPGRFMSVRPRMPAPTSSRTPYLSCCRPSGGSFACFHLARSHCA